MTDISVGDYVYATKWSDGDKEDPWAVGTVVEVDEKRNRPYNVEFSVSGVLGTYWFKYACKLESAEHGKFILENRPFYLNVEQAQTFFNRDV